MFNLFDSLKSFWNETQKLLFSQYFFFGRTFLKQTKHNIVKPIANNNAMKLKIL